MYRWQRFLVLMILVFGLGNQCFAQDPLPTDDLGNVSDAFQENFFEALKQKGIQNYEKALSSLESALKAAKDDTDNKSVVYFEMAKNHLALKNFRSAENALQQSNSLTPGRFDVNELLYEVYHTAKEYEKAIPIVEKLISFDKVYKEDLANLYVKTERYEEAIALINELDETVGRNAQRDSLRRRVISITGDVSSEITRLEGITTGETATEQDYLELIYRYSTEGNTAQAEEVANQLVARYPDSELAHLALYKFALDKGDKDAAVQSMQKILGAKSIDENSKYKVLADFMDFTVKNPGYENALNDAISSFTESVDSAALWQQLGDFFLQQNNSDKALEFYEKGVAMDSQNYALIKNTLLLQIDNQAFDRSLELTETALEVYPAQALLYLLKGVSLIGLDNPADAIEILEEGVDYVIDDQNMEKDFYNQLSKAYTMQGNSAKAEEYAKKARDLGTP